MRSLARISTPIAETLHRSELVAANTSAWDAATNKAREKALIKYAAVNAVLTEQKLHNHKSPSAAVDALLAREGYRPETEKSLYCGRGGKLTSRASLISWVSSYNKHGMDGLLPAHKGSAAKSYGWEHRALALYQTPTQRNMTRVAEILQQEGHATATSARVRAYLNRLPVSQTEYSAKRLGKHYHQQNIGAYVTRDMSNLPVGHTYMADGHLCDVYVAHPSNAKPWRPELTVWLDWRSKYVVGWGISNAESAISTLHSLSATISKHDHVPAVIYTDPGSGFKNKMITDGFDSFCDRLGITPMFALPGNAKGKGLVEVWFRWFEERVGTDFPTYTSHNRTDDMLRGLTAKVERGDITLPTLEQYKDAIASYVDWYNAQVRKDLKCSPAQMWEKLEPVASEVKLEQLLMPTYTRTVRRERIEFNSRHYSHGALAHFHGKKVRIEVDLNNDSVVFVRDMDDRFICEAVLVERRQGLSDSFIEDTNQRRLDAQLKRLDKKAQQVIEESRKPIEGEGISLDDLIGRRDVLSHQQTTPNQRNRPEVKIEDVYK